MAHTGVVAGEDADLDARFRERGIVRVSDVHELAAFPAIFGQPKQARGRRVAIVSNSGGLGVMMVDQCRDLGLQIARLSEATIDRLKLVLPGFASVVNPVDVTAQLLNDKRLLSSALRILSADPNVDIIILALGVMAKGYDIPLIVQDIALSNTKYPQVMAVAWVGGLKGVVEELSAHGVPAFEDSSLCTRAVARYADYCLAVGETTAGSAEADPFGKA
jgi:acyl-CoA synthetase (NDP forming)